MKSLCVAISLFLFWGGLLKSQTHPSTGRIDIMLINGEYSRVIDTCNQIISVDSSDASVHYKLGLAYQNMLAEDKAFASFRRAASLDTLNNTYKFGLAKAYFNRNKFRQAESLFRQLNSADSLNWSYAYYLTSIYMQNGRYEQAADIYTSFLSRDTSNYSLLDKSGFAYLRMGDFETAKDFYNRSLDINPENTSALKNLSYLYASTGQRDTATQLLTRAIKIDPADMDLYSRRGQILFSQNYTSRGLNDYLVLLANGDSSAINLKRAGIGHCNNMQPAKAIPFLLRSYLRDSGDYETCSYLGQAYYNLKEMQKSIYYYKRTLKVLSPIYLQTGLTYVLLAESQKVAEKYDDALASYLKAQEFKVDPNIYLIIANIYDEQIGNKANAIKYYQLFLNTFTKLSKTTFTAEYIDSIKKRLEFLKEEQKKK